MSATLHLEDVTHRFPGTARLFEPVTLDVQPGEVLGLCGPSGCGKSTLLSIIAGWVTPGEGTVQRHAVERVSWVFQNPHGVPGRTAIDHVALPYLARGFARAEAEDRALAVMSLFGLTRLWARPFQALSGGEAQRLMLARAVATEPDLLLVDEPTAQLDTATAHSVNETLTALAGGGSIVVIATHDPDTRAACTTVLDLAAHVALVEFEEWEAA
ncbi:MAG: ATP-binding cassette domain-containing protein [Microbacterium sp.]